jgi:nitroimidazol reductase NimA-like FMN-containing flavoprotein (pyridoxamine 5'-phosphate oxidase superfamily)
MEGYDDAVAGNKLSDSEPDLRELPTRQRIQALLDEQLFAVLCTQGGGQPYGSVIAYAVGPELRTVTFATPTATRKYRLLSECESVALVVDSRSKFAEDMMKVEAVTATGRAVQLQPGPEFDRWASLLTQRHPQLQSFVYAPSSALFRIDVLRYLHVSRFQEVHQWIPEASSLNS